MQCHTILTSWCANPSCLDKFERQLHEYWSTESVTNKEFLHTQAYRVFRVNVLINMNAMKSNPYSQLPYVTCALNNNYRLEFHSLNSSIILKRFWEQGSSAVACKRKQDTDTGYFSV